MHHMLRKCVFFVVYEFRLACRVIYKPISHMLSPTIHMSYIPTTTATTTTTSTTTSRMQAKRSENPNGLAQPPGNDGRQHMFA